MSDIRITPEVERERAMSFSFETTKLNGVIYNVEKLASLAESLPVLEVPTSNFDNVVAQGNHYWLDAQGTSFGPWDIFHDWDKAQQNPAWVEHIATIKQANLNRPLWVTPDGNVFNGLHRLTRAILDKKSVVKVVVFEDVPDSARVPNQ